MTTHESRGKGSAPSASQVIRAALREPVADTRRTREDRVLAVCVMALLAACGLAIWLGLLVAW